MRSPGWSDSVSSRSSAAGSNGIHSRPFLRRTPIARSSSRPSRGRRSDVLRQHVASGGYRVVLLHGVTGSGKTEIYVRLASEVRTAGRSVLLMVPEIALTPAAAAHFPTGVRCARRHSPQRSVRRRALRPVAADQARRDRRGGRHPKRRVRATRQHRTDRRRRGARQLVQAGRGAALPRLATWR